VQKLRREEALTKNLKSREIASGCIKATYDLRTLYKKAISHMEPNRPVIDRDKDSFETAMMSVAGLVSCRCASTSCLHLLVAIARSRRSELGLSAPRHSFSSVQEL